MHQSVNLLTGDMSLVNDLTVKLKDFIHYGVDVVEASFDPFGGYKWSERDFIHELRLGSSDYVIL